MNAREEILRRIRSSLGDVPATETAESFAVPRDYQRSCARGGDAVATADLFVERVEDYRAMVTRVPTQGDLPAAVTAALGGDSPVLVGAWLDPAWLPAGLDVVSDDPQLTPYGLDAARAVITSAAVAVAVTGTVVLDHSVGQGRRALSLIPDRHVCVVRTSQLVDDLPAAVAALRPSVLEGRPLTWISGPSATSDIELDRVEGVHGPRTLHILLLTDDA